MKFVIILTGGRSGSDLLQSLFDCHPQIMQFPGMFRFDKPFLDILDERNPKNIPIKFCKLNPHFFDSRIQKTIQPELGERPDTGERHHMLGKNKNEYYRFSEKKFEKEFANFYKKSKKRKIDKLIAIHEAYDKISSKKSNKKKIIIIHLHLIEHFKSFVNKFNKINDYKILLTIRDPLVSICSTVNHWLKYKSGQYLYTKSIYDNINMHVNIFNELYKFRKKLFIVQLENLHLEKTKVIKGLCKLLRIHYKTSLTKSTYFNKNWWGDEVSGKFLNGLNPKFKNNFDKSLFFNKDIKIIENKIANVLTNYNYPKRSKMKDVNKYIKFLPFKFEYIVWWNTLKIKNIKQLLLVPFFLIKRIIIFCQENLYTKKQLPDSIKINR
jgi:hypothetical protein